LNLEDTDTDGLQEGRFSRCRDLTSVLCNSDKDGRGHVTAETPDEGIHNALHHDKLSLLFGHISCHHIEDRLGAQPGQGGGWEILLALWLVGLPSGEEGLVDGEEEPEPLSQGSRVELEPDTSRGPTGEWKADPSGVAAGRRW